ncbi:unnamed protein product [Thelazia callipaeda]|uniref:MIT domain-containing protein n=1 Tax=Thelazia callipaeda TaxID=103827 RepID=A0A0N5CWZ1_THECL|nr:unnamed protein product [Thelazia callipaeda]
MQTFISRSRPTLQKAVELDRDNRKNEAIEKYAEGISLLLEALTCDDSTENNKQLLREKISKYLMRAEVLKGQTKREVLSVQQIHIKHNDIGFGYERIFKRCADITLSQIDVHDAYIRLPYQVLNFLRFCELFVLHAPNLKKIHLRTHHDARTVDMFKELKSSLACRDIELEVNYDDKFHDREIRFSNGWVVKIGRGLNYFQSVGRCEIGSCDLNLRKCYETNVDIFQFKVSQ